MSQKILIIDDDLDLRRLISNCLKTEGYQVVAVSHASEALLLAQDAGLNLMILDLDLGGENGLMLMKHLRQTHPGVPVILYTGMDHDAASIERMREQGAAQYVRKGPLPALLEAVRAELSKSSPN